MHRSVSRYPNRFLNNSNQLSTERERIIVSEEDQLSPVALLTRDANLLSLPPLRWSQYDTVPDTVYARNSGFTLIIQALFNGEVPHLSSGPLSGQYNFSQIHFHWGQHDETGSGHSVDGIRYPLEMHIVHVKRNCDNLNEARGAKDGIAIAVHLFALSEERNTRLDQLIAVLQFIQEANCCARLYPSSLSEIVCPFGEDYFLYRGAVPGSSQQQYQIVWLVSRRELIVSSQQLQQFRKLQNEKGNFILANSNKPHPLGDRTLFLVSPSEKTGEPILHRPPPSVITSESEKSLDIVNAEFKTLVALEETEVGRCAICPHPNHAGAKIQTKQPGTIVERDTSIKESCADLGILHGSRLVVKTDFNNDNEQNEYVYVTKGNSYNLEYVPPHDSHPAEGKPHLSYKSVIVRKSDPSTEQACILLGKSLSVHSAASAPSLTRWGYLGATKEFTDISVTQAKIPSEMLVSENSFESLGTKKQKVSKKSVVFDETTLAKTEKPAVLRSFRDNATQSSRNALTTDEKCTSWTLLGQFPEKKEWMADQEFNDCKSNEGEVFTRAQSKYFLVKQQSEPKKSLYKVIGEFFITPDSKRTFMKHVGNPNEELLTETSDESPKQSNGVFKKVVLSLPPSTGEIIENRIEENLYVEHSENTSNNNNVKKQLNVDSNSRVTLDKGHSSKNYKCANGMGEETPRKYYVTKITPIKSQQDNREGPREKKLFYAKPLHMKREVSNERGNELDMSSSNETDSIYKKTQNSTNSIKENPPETHHPDNIDKNYSHLTRNILINEDANCVLTSPSQSTSPKSKKSISNKMSHTVRPDISIKVLKNQTEDNTTNIHGDLNDNPLNRSNINKKIELAVSIKSKKETPVNNNQEENLKLDGNHLKFNNITDNSDFENSNDDNFLEELEENTVYFSEQTKKKIKIQVTTPTYKVPNQPPATVYDHVSSQHLVTIQKVEIPDPFYLRRAPRQPLVEYEAFPTGHHKHVTEEMMTEERTVETHTSTKKNTKQITIDVNRPKETLLYDNMHNKNKIGELKNTHIISTNENNVVDNVSTIVQPNNLNNLLFDHQNQSTNFKNYETPSVHKPESANFTITINNNKLSSINKNVIADKKNSKYVNNPTSNPSKSFTVTTQYSPNQQSQGLNFDIQEEPTKDPGLNSSVKEINVKTLSKKEIIPNRVSVMDKSTNEEHSLPPKQPNIVKLNSNTVAKVDEAAIVYIHQPKTNSSLSSNQLSLVTHGTVPSTILDSPLGNNTEVEQETKSEGLIKVSKLPGNPRMARSESMYAHIDKSEELISIHDYDNVKEVSDSSYCNLTLKSETKFKLPSSQVVEMKSLAEVRFKPIKQSGHVNPNKSESRNPVKDTTNTTEGKCCSGIELKKEIVKQIASVETSTSVDEDEREMANTSTNFSPVAIETDKTVIKMLPRLQFIDHWNRSSSEDALLVNNGKTVRATLLENTEPPHLRGGPLDSDYMFAELHFHWGRKDCCGAEHIIDNQRHTMEAHFMYYKKEYNSVKEALAYDDGIAIVALQFKAGGPSHSMFDLLIRDLAMISEAGTGVYVPTHSLFSWIKQTVEEAKGYFSYKGTMTLEPPFLEVVTWLIFEQPIIFCCQQSLQFRNLRSQNGEPLLKTYRTTQPLNNRTIYYVPL